MLTSLLDRYNAFIRRRYRWIIIAWFVIILISLPFIPRFFSSVSYSITGAESAFGGTAYSESSTAAKILQTEFPGSNNEGHNSILVVVQGAKVYSDPVKNAVLSLNNTIFRNKGISNYTGESSVYAVEYDLLNASLPTMITQVASLESNITSINMELYSLKQNLSSLSTNLFQLEQGINQTSQLIYGLPATFIGIWSQAVSQGASNPYVANQKANSTIFEVTQNFGDSPESIGYYSLFFQIWNSTFQTFPDNTTALQRETISVNQSVPIFLNNSNVDTQTKQLVTSVATGLNVTDWNQINSISNLTISTLAPSIPAQLLFPLGVTSTGLLGQLYSFGPSASSTKILSYTVSLLESSFADSMNSSFGFPISQLLNSASTLGSSPSFSQKWELASTLVSKATQSVFNTSPLFSVNSTSLGSLLSSLSPNVTITDIDRAIEGVVSNQTFFNYPYLMADSLTENFVSNNNNSMIVILSFSSPPDSNSIAQVMSDVQASGLQNFGAAYVTGASVVTQDVQNVFAPALTLTVGPGVLFSILVVGLLFLSPIAALIPVLMGGISISVALAAIYLEIVSMSHGNLTFLTPTLSILLILGLSVDYAVLQLRRTREERLQGKSTEESIGISVKWAGQAVLTAGITVIAAYIVLAIANVPLFSDVGTSIALGVSILLAVSLTLLPSLEMALRDRIFWPEFGRRSKTKHNLAERTGNGTSETRLKRLAGATLKRKVIIVAFISLLAFTAFYVVYVTPVGEDFLRLIPNFPSNQGLAVITYNFGSRVTGPTYVIATTATSITYGNNQLNQTLLNQLEQISDAVANSSGVVSVASPTRPFASHFNYASIENISMPIRLQYEEQILSMIGQDNKTAVINVGFSSPAESQAAITSLLQMEKNVDKIQPKGFEIHFGGSTQSTYDGQLFISGLLPEIVLILAAAVYIILFFQLRSVFTPIRLIFTILCSVVFSLAILSAIFYYGLNLPILDFAPLFVVVTMLGVGIDYDIFFVTRIREEVLNGKTDDEAIKTAIDRVWITILGLGLVLSIVFASLLVTGIAILQEISLALSAAILIDVSVVILFLVPSLMGLAQRLNWWPSRISKRNSTKGE